MEAKLCLVLMLIILGILTVQGAMPRNKKKNPLEVLERRIVCKSSCDPLIKIVCSFLIENLTG